jgi:hypothetical protein
VHVLVWLPNLKKNNRTWPNTTATTTTLPLSHAARLGHAGPVLESQITSCITDASQEERITLISILVFIVPDSTMMFVHLSVNVMLMDGYKHH